MDGNQISSTMPPIIAIPVAIQLQSGTNFNNNNSYTQQNSNQMRTAMDSGHSGQLDAGVKRKKGIIVLYYMNRYSLKSACALLVSPLLH